MITAVVAFLLAGGIFFFYTKPAYSGPGTIDSPSISEMKGQIAQYNDALEKVQQLQQLKSKLLAKYNSFNPDDINRLQTMIPDHVDNIGLILELDSLASRYGMSLENADIDTTNQPAAGSSNTAATGAIQTDAKKYDTLALHFSTFGTYANFSAFLHDLESSLRVVDLSKLTFAAQPDNSSKSDPTFHYDITINTYWLK